MPADSVAPERNYPALFLALDDVLEALDAGRPDEDALRRSFEGSVEGFGAGKALLLRVEPDGLRAVASRGLSAEEVSACEGGRSVPGVSSSRIREAVESRRPVMVQDPRLMGPAGTEALRGRPVSVLCAPVCDPLTREALAVLYVQNEGVRNAFGEIDRAWIEVYARALGRVMAPSRREARA
ncbi:MAG TPA: GAF domain-containing protein [Conexibacter sp.]|nr:GAF domain-containing protein [Conexibacter sp.]